MLQRVMTSQSRLSTLRLTVDSSGISKVERLLNRPQYAGECTSRSAFIIVQDDSASGSKHNTRYAPPYYVFPIPTAPTILFELQDGCLRLIFQDLPSFQIWNTPAPPSLALCTTYPADAARLPKLLCR